VRTIILIFVAILFVLGIIFIQGNVAHQNEVNAQVRTQTIDGDTLFIRNMNYKGHQYIVLYENAGVGMEHDPDCPCHNVFGK
jgi:hypothetical protein